MPPRPKTSARRAPAAADEAPATPRAGRIDGEVEEEAAVDPQVVVPVDPEPVGGEETAGGYPSENEDDAPGPIDPVADGALPLGDPDVVADEEEEPTLEEAEDALGTDVALAVAGTAVSADKAAEEAIAKHRAEKGYAAPNKPQKAAEAKLATAARKEWVEKQWVPQAEVTVIEPPKFVPPPAPRRKKRDADGKETEDEEPVDAVKDFEAAYKRPVGKGGPSLNVLKLFTSKSGAFAFWSLFFTPGLMGVMVKNSNAYALSLGAGEEVYRDLNGFSFSSNFLYQSFGLLYRNGLHPVPDLDLMFADPTTSWVYGDSRVRNIFGPNSLRKFYYFRAFFHIQHPIETRFVAYNMDSGNFVPMTHTQQRGPFAKLEPLLGVLMHTCMTSWVLGANFAFDEVTIGFQGRHALAQRITYKNEGDGFLFDALCEAGYLWCWAPRHVPLASKPEPKASDLHNRCLWMLALVAKYTPGGSCGWRHVFFDNLFTSFAFIVWCAAREVLGCGVARKGGRGVPEKVIQAEISKKKAVDVKGTMKAAMRKIKVGSMTMLVMAASVYDTKPVNVMTSVHMAATLDTHERKVWSHSEGRRVPIFFKRMNCIDEYNTFMNSVDRQDHLRGNYRPDGPWMRNRKWWWSIFLFSLGVGATNAYLLYVAVCKAEGMTKQGKKAGEWMSHRDFLVQLSDQLCHEELRKPKKAEPQRSSPRKRPTPDSAGSAPDSASGAADGGAQDSKKVGQSGTQSASITWAKVSRARTGYDANQHPHRDPFYFESGGRSDCQWCTFKWREACKPIDPKWKPKSVGAKYKGPQNKETMFCMNPFCQVRFCSSSCFNEYHGTVPVSPWAFKA